MVLGLELVSSVGTVVPRENWVLQNKAAQTAAQSSGSHISTLSSVKIMTHEVPSTSTPTRGTVQTRSLLFNVRISALIY